MDGDIPDVTLTGAFLVSCAAPPGKKCSALCLQRHSRHTSITQAAELGQRAGLGLDKIRAHSRHRSIATLMLYVDEHNRQRTQTTLADLVAATLTS
jgi:hypothetical protein